MHIDIIKKDGKLWLENIECDCSMNHVIPKMDIFIKPGLINDCADCIAQTELGKKVLIVADRITYEVAAKVIESSLIGAGFDCRTCVLPGEDIEPTPQMTKVILSMIEDDTEFLLAVGSGVVTDLTRRSAFFSKKPFAVFGTAASMDGYTSSSSSMMEDGMKITRYGEAARLLMFDTDILSKAPQLMQASGVGDVFAKYNVLVDWRLGRDVAGEAYCPLCAHLVKQALDTCMDAVDEIASGTQAGAQALIEALIYAGLSVLVVGSTRPVASIEHNMSHYWEMTALAYGGSAPSHGIGVGIGLIYALMFHEMLREADLTKIDKEKIKANRMTQEQKKAFLLKSYPGHVGEEVMQANDDWYISWQEQERRIDALIACHERYKKDSAALPDWRHIMEVLQKLGAPVTAKQAGISKERLWDTLLCTKDYRLRYNIGAALDELGMLDECAKRVMEAEEAFTQGVS